MKWIKQGTVPPRETIKERRNRRLKDIKKQYAEMKKTGIYTSDYIFAVLAYNHYLTKLTIQNYVYSKRIEE